MPFIVERENTYDNKVFLDHIMSRKKNRMEDKSDTTDDIAKK